MYEVQFEYKDKYTHGRWVKQSCYVRSVKECIDFYGLGIDCEYKITSVIDRATGKTIDYKGND